MRFRLSVQPCSLGTTYELSLSFFLSKITLTYNILSIHTLVFALDPKTSFFLVLFCCEAFNLSGGLRKLVMLPANTRRRRRRRRRCLRCWIHSDCFFNRRRDTALSVVLNILLHWTEGARRRCPLYSVIHSGVTGRSGRLHQQTSYAPSCRGLFSVLARKLTSKFKCSCLDWKLFWVK